MLQDTAIHYNEGNHPTFHPLPLGLRQPLPPDRILFWVVILQKPRGREALQKKLPGTEFQFNSVYGISVGGPLPHDFSTEAPIKDPPIVGGLFMPKKGGFPRINMQGTIDAYHWCISFMYFIHVFHSCTSCMYIICVYYSCVSFIHIIHVHHLFISHTSRET